MVMSRLSVQSTYPHFSWASLDQVVNQYSVNIHSLVTNSQRKEENDRRKYFMIDLHESKGPGWDHTHSPWISNQTHAPGPDW